MKTKATNNSFKEALRLFVFSNPCILKVVKGSAYRIATKEVKNKKAYPLLVLTNNGYASHIITNRYFFKMEIVVYQKKR